MLVVMLVLLMITSLAVFSAYSTSSEVRAAGFVQRSSQAENIAEAGMDAVLGSQDSGAMIALLSRAMITTQNDPAYPLPSMAPFEVELQPNAHAYRIFSEDFVSGAFSGAQPPVADAALGAGTGLSQPYTPSFEVDVIDSYVCPSSTPGEEVGGRAPLVTHCRTFVSRGRLRLRGGDFAGTAALDAVRQYNESISQVRVTAESRGSSL